MFLVIKDVEYHEKWVDHHIPGPGFHYADPHYFHQAQILFFLYFAMTGMHALHMIVGLGLVTTLDRDGGAQSFQHGLVHSGRR